MDDDPTPHLGRYESYEQACREFRWFVPERFNIASAILSRHPDAITRVALIEAKLGGLNTYTYGGLDYLSDKFANALNQQGVQAGDSAVLILPQSAAGIIAQLALLKLGAIVTPLSLFLDTAALEFSLNDSAPKAAVVHHKLRGRLRTTGAAIETVFSVNKLDPEFQDVSPDHDFWRAVFEASADYKTAETSAHSPAFAFYVPTSEGRLVRVTHTHASLIYQLPAFEMCHTVGFGDDSTLWSPRDWDSVDSTHWSPRDWDSVDSTHWSPRDWDSVDSTHWSPRDWGSVDSSLCSIYPALWYGWRIAASYGREPATNSSSLIERCEVTDLFATQSEVEALLPTNQLSNQDHTLKPLNIVCPSTAPAEVHAMTSQPPDGSINTLYTNAWFGSIAASCKRWYEMIPGSVGRAAPGYSIEPVDEQGDVLPFRSKGRLAIRRENRDASVEPRANELGKFASSLDGWIISNDVGFKDEDGNIWLAESK